MNGSYSPVQHSAVRMPCYPCHIIALAEYLAHLECATLLQSSPSPCLLPSLFCALLQRLSAGCCCARSAFQPAVRLRTMPPPPPAVGVGRRGAGHCNCCSRPRSTYACVCSSSERPPARKSSGATFVFPILREYFWIGYQH